MANGLSEETGLPTKWTTTENITWKLPLPGLSGSTPIVWGNHIFLNVAENGSLFLWAVDREKGVPLWKQHLGDGDNKQRKHNMFTTPSPVTDGRNVWIMTGTGILKAFDFKGKEVWARDLQKEYGAFGLNWGYGSSPMLHDDSLYVQVLHGMKTDDPSYVLRINKTSGKTIWKVERATKAEAAVSRRVHHTRAPPPRWETRGCHHRSRREPTVTTLQPAPSYGESMASTPPTTVRIASWPRQWSTTTSSSPPPGCDPCWC